jgi:hypothetical protein
MKVQSLCLINLILCYEDVWGSGGRTPSFLTSALDGGEWSASRPCCFTPGEKAPGTDWIGGWVDTRAGLNAVEKSLPSQESKPSHPAHSPSLYPLSYLYSIPIYKLFI